MSGVGTKERLVSAGGFGPKDMFVSRLWDIYAPLLTPHQREITDLYFNYDLSLGEIAEQKGVSRQSVSDCLAKSRRLLEAYEEKLGVSSLLERLSEERIRASSFVLRWTEQMRAEHPEWNEELSSLEEVFKEGREE